MPNIGNVPNVTQVRFKMVNSVLCKFRLQKGGGCEEKTQKLFSCLQATSLSYTSQLACVGGSNLSTHLRVGVHEGLNVRYQEGAWHFKDIQKEMLLLSIFIYLFTFRERGREGEREGEKHQCVRDTWTDCLSHAPTWGPGPQPRHVP